MEKIVLTIHVLTALAIIGMILLQQGKGAEAGASFGSGASQTMFGSAGSWNFFSKVTAILATVFFVTSFSLAVIAKKNSGVETIFMPEAEVIEVPVEQDMINEIPVSEGDIPALEQSSGELDGDIPAADPANQ